MLEYITDRVQYLRALEKFLEKSRDLLGMPVDTGHLIEDLDFNQALELIKTQKKRIMSAKWTILMRRRRMLHYGSL
jgi:hypothetical protein